MFAGARFSPDMCPSCFSGLETFSRCPVCDYPVRINEQHMLPVGHILNDRYWIGHCLGQGGFGITYLAYDQATASRVAVKEHFANGLCVRRTFEVNPVASSMEDDFQKGKRRFYEEARNLSQFRDTPNIVSVLECFNANGTSYLVMPYYQGKTLLAYLQQCAGGRLPFEEAIQRLAPVMRALNVVHSRGLVHRDVRPDNIFITDEGMSILLDFGAARFAFSQKAEKTLVTKIVKDGYSPPEQYGGSGKKMSLCSDVYSMGATLYKVLTGTRPPSPLERYLGEEVAPPGSKVDGIADYVDAAILRALSLDPQHRYESMGNFLSALEKQEVECCASQEDKAPKGTPKDEDKPPSSAVKPTGERGAHVFFRYLPHMLLAAGLALLLAAFFLWQQSNH